MSRNLIAYFGGKPDCKQYTVKITSNSSNTVYDEILLAGDSPFVVTYDTTNTPFEPVRASRASITCVASDYLLDVYTSGAHGTSVTLEDEDGIAWTGFLTSNLLNMPQDSCGPTTFAMEAQDCLYTLDKFNYTTVGSHKAIVTFADIMRKVMTTCEGLDKLYVDLSMLRDDGTYIGLEDLSISEKNFFSSDTDDPWTMKEVLEEMCRYLGYTATQYKDALYLFDMQSHSDYTFQTDTETTMPLTCRMYSSSDGWSAYTQGSFTDLAKGVTLRQDIVRGTGSDISLETLYNKIQVKDSFYEIDEFVPDFFEDEKLTNRLGNQWESTQITKSGKFRYFNKNGKVKKEEKNENEHIYYIRKYDHDDYESVYRNPTNLSEVSVSDGLIISNTQYTQASDPLSRTGTYDVSLRITNKSGSQKSIEIRSILSYGWFDISAGESEEGEYVEESDVDSDSFTLANNGVRDVSLHCEVEYQSGVTLTTYYASTISVDGVSHELTFYDDTASYVGATIVDLATFDKPMSITKYNYETEANIDFTKYIMIHQLDKPSSRQHPYQEWTFLVDIPPLLDTEIDDVFPSVMRTRGDFYNPMIIDDNAYIAIDANAIWERYNVPYINPDWTKENSWNNGLGLLSKLENITTCVPGLVFELRVGNKWWSSNQNEWLPSQCCFVVNMSTDKTDDDDVDWTEFWNTDHAALNNVDWTDWAGVQGYKIPLEKGMDMNQPIEFAIHLPSRLQCLGTNVSDESWDGVNNYCWISKLNVKFATKGSEIYDNSDVIYENVINSGSVNTLSDITCKFTTYPGEGKHSYSTVALDGEILEGMIKTGLDGEVNKPEENIIKAYANQYSNSTIKQTMTLTADISPFSRIKDPVLDKYFGILGTSIDYHMGSQTMTLIETKGWSLE